MSKKEKKQEATSLDENDHDTEKTVIFSITKRELVERKAARAAAGKKEAARVAAGKKEAARVAAGKKEARKPAVGKKEAAKVTAGKKEAGRTVSVSLAKAKMSELVSRIVDGDDKDFETDEDGKEYYSIALYLEDMETLEKVVDFMKLYSETKMKEIEQPIKSVNLVELVGPEYANFIDVKQSMLFKLIMAANYLEIEPLLLLACTKIASMLKGKTPEQIREDFGIKDDFTPEERRRLEAENAWAREG